MANGRLTRKKKGFSDRQITQGFKQLAEKLEVLSILIEIINPYFNKYIINVHPFNWIIVELNHHVYGQTARCWFDEAKRDYKTISISELYKQITQSKKYNKFSSDQKQAIEEIGQLIEKNRKKYEKKLKDFADKYYAHNENRTDIQRRKEYENLKVSWENITTLIETAKKITNELCKYWQNKELDFGKGNYQYFREGFWEVIDSKYLKLRPVNLK